MKIGLLGYGKMGKTIEKIAMERGHEIAWTIHSNNKSEVVQSQLFMTADVVIEFTQPELAPEHIQLCLEHQIPVVVGTTGWYKSLENISKLVNNQQGTLFYASNFSLGVNLFFAANRYLAKIMNHHSEYRVSIEETHHTQKLDAPSGTAITTAEQIIQNHSGYTDWNINHASQNNIIPIIAHRIDQVPGTHIVNYTSEIDEITLKHEAKNRLGFALGAVVAAEWLPGKKGVFTMNDMLDFKV